MVLRFTQPQGGRGPVLDEEVEIDLSTLDKAETGGEFTRGDYVVLAVLGILIPAILLFVGAL